MSHAASWDRLRRIHRTEVRLPQLGQLWSSSTKRLFEVSLKLTSNANQLRIPLQFIGYVLESAVVQFIEHPQGRLCIFGAIGFRGVAQRCRVCIVDCCKNTVAHRTAGFTKEHLGAPCLKRITKLVLKEPVYLASLTTVTA